MTDELREEIIKLIEPEIDHFRENSTFAKCRAAVLIAETRADEIIALIREREGNGVVGEIAAERRRQSDIEGYTAKRDDEYADNALALAAACYADPISCGTKRVPEYYAHNGRAQAGDNEWTPVGEVVVPARWPWDGRWWKPKEPRRDLVRAAALLVAEIERLDRAEEPHP